MHPTLRALHERNLMICVGPLVSGAVGLPGPGELAERCLATLEGFGERERELVAELVRVGEISRGLGRAEEVLSSGSWALLLRGHLDRGDTRLPLVVRALAELSPALRRICTTNLDTLLERGLGWPAFEVEVRDLSERPRWIMKMCGSASLVSSWVLTDTRMAGRLAELPQTGAWLRSQELLLVGYGADDEVLHRLLLRLRGRTREARGVALVPAESVSPVVQELLGEHGIDVVPIAGDYDVGAAEWLHALSEAFDPQVRGRGAWRMDDLRMMRKNPYPGLFAVPGRSELPGATGSRPELFGRAAEVHRALEQVRARPQSRWLLVHGEDGVGKSSFLAGGLVPALRREASATLPGPGRWEVYYGEVGPEPLVWLAQELYGLLAARGERPVGEVFDVHEGLRQRSRGLTDLLVEEWPEGLVLVLDSFEEAIRCADAFERESFAAVLAHALVHAPVPFLLVTGVRSGALGELHQLPQLYEGTVGAEPPVSFLLAPLTEVQLREVIVGPAERAGFLVAERFVSRVLEDVAQLRRAGVAPGEVMAMMSAALHESVRQSERGELTVEVYEAAGGVFEVIDRLAEESFRRGAAGWKAGALRSFVLELVAVEPGGRRVRAPQPVVRALQTLIREEGLSPVKGETRAMEVLYALCGADGRGLIKVSAMEVMLAHDVLLTRWHRLREWLTPSWADDVAVDGPAASRRWVSDDAWRWSAILAFALFTGATLAVIHYGLPP